MLRFGETKIAKETSFSGKSQSIFGILLVMIWLYQNKS